MSGCITHQYCCGSLSVLINVVVAVLLENFVTDDPPPPLGSEDAALTLQSTTATALEVSGVALDVDPQRLSNLERQVRRLIQICGLRFQWRGAVMFAVCDGGFAGMLSVCVLPHAYAFAYVYTRCLRVCASHCRWGRWTRSLI